MTNSKSIALFKIEHYLETKGLKKEEFLEKLELSKNAFQEWNKGSKPKLETFKKMKELIPELQLEDFDQPYIERWRNIEDAVDKIYKNDTIEILKKLPDNSIHLVLTSPPYNAGHNYDEYNDTLDWMEYKNFLKKVIQEIYRVLVKGGRFVINVPFAVKNKNTKEVKFLATIITGICEEIGFKEFEFIIWHKGKSQNHFQGNNTAWGSWKSPSNPVFRPLGEAIMVFSKEQTKLEGDKNKVDLTAEEFKEWTKNIWYIVNNQNKKEHPCPFPEELAKRIIKLYSYKDNIVLDPFNGVGTTTKVAYELERRYIGIDLSDSYCKIAKNKIKETKWKKQQKILTRVSVNSSNQNTNINFEKLINPSFIPNEFVNRWFYLKESFSKTLVEKLLLRYNKNAQKILDPFMGAGSTLFESYIEGKKGYGFDVNPISKLAVEVKCQNYTSSDIKKLSMVSKEIDRINPKIQNYPNWLKITKYINPDKLDLLLTMKSYIETIDNKKVAKLLNLLWLSILEDVGDFKKDGNGIKYKAKNVGIKDIYNIFKNKIEIAINDIENYLLKIERKGKVVPFLKSSMDIDKMKKIREIDAVITSPPYANMFDYFEVYKIELWMGGFIKNYEDWRTLKKMAMRNNINTNLNPKDIIRNEIFAEIYDKLQYKVKEGLIKEKRVPVMIANYFYDTKTLLTSLKEKMNKNGIISFIVGNSAYGGIIVPTDEIIKSIGKELGYNFEEIIVARSLRTSSQQMPLIKEEDKKLLRESIVTFRYIA